MTRGRAILPGVLHRDDLRFHSAAEAEIIAGSDEIVPREALAIAEQGRTAHRKLHRLGVEGHAQHRITTIMHAEPVDGATRIGRSREPDEGR